jgi:hypothetical protein
VDFWVSPSLKEPTFYESFDLQLIRSGGRFSKAESAVRRLDAAKRREEHEQEPFETTAGGRIRTSFLAELLVDDLATAVTYQERLDPWHGAGHIAHTS